MKLNNSLLILPVLLFLPSCVVYPSVTEHNPDGSIKSITTLGGSFLSLEKKPVKSLVKYKTDPATGAVIPELALNATADSTNTAVVPQAYITGETVQEVAGLTARSTDLVTKTDGAVNLKKAKDPNVLPTDPNIRILNEGQTISR